MNLPLLLRSAAIAIVALLILVPLALVNGKIYERQSRAQAVQSSFAHETSGPQTIVGPFLALTCEETLTEERQVMRAGKAETIAEKKIGACPTGYFTPRDLQVTTRLPVEERKRGIYSIRMYRASVAMAGEIEWPAPAAGNGLNPRVWKRAYLVMAVSDQRGVKSLSGTPFASGVAGVDPRFGLQAELGDFTGRKPGEALPFAFSMDLIGTTAFDIAPVGDTTRIEMTSNWPHPSFTGSWRPDKREISDAGFQATWQTSHFATGGQSVWQKQAQDGSIFQTRSVTGLSLFDPVNVYALAHRATDYGFLFVIFTFAGLALAEVVAGIRLHAIQYALVGSALAVFFLLLIAMAEQTSFLQAYAIAAAACVALLAFYLRHPLGTWARTAAFLVLFVALYGALYFVLVSEDHALLMGSLLVFGVLAAVMVLTRKVDWSAFAAKLSPPRRVVPRTEPL